MNGGLPESAGIGEPLLVLESSGLPPLVRSRRGSVDSPGGATYPKPEFGELDSAGLFAVGNKPCTNSSMFFGACVSFGDDNSFSAISVIYVFLFL